MKHLTLTINVDNVNEMDKICQTLDEKYPHYAYERISDCIIELVIYRRRKKLQETIDLINNL